MTNSSKFWAALSCLAAAAGAQAVGVGTVSQDITFNVTSASVNCDITNHNPTINNWPSAQLGKLWSDYYTANATTVAVGNNKYIANDTEKTISVACDTANIPLTFTIAGAAGYSTATGATWTDSIYANTSGNAALSTGPSTVIYITSIDGVPQTTRASAGSGPTAFTSTTGAVSTPKVFGWKPALETTRNPTVAIPAAGTYTFKYTATVTY